MTGRYIYWFMQIPAAIAVILCVTTDIFARYHLPRIHDRVAVCAGLLGGFAALLWQAIVQARELGRKTPRADLASMF